MVDGEKVPPFWGPDDKVSEDGNVVTTGSRWFSVNWKCCGKTCPGVKEFANGDGFPRAKPKK